MFATLPTRRTARERQQAVLRDCAQRYPGLAPLFTVKEKNNYAVTHRAGLDELPPRFATLQHHLTNDDNTPSTATSPNIQHVVHPAQAALLDPNGTMAPTATAAPVHQVPLILVTIQPHAALTPQEVAQHTLLRQIGLLPRGTPEETQARREGMEEDKKNPEVKKQRLAPKKKAKAENATDQLLKHVKGGRVEKQRIENTTMKKRVATKGKAAEEEGQDDTKELWV